MSPTNTKHTLGSTATDVSVADTALRTIDTGPSLRMAECLIGLTRRAGGLSVSYNQDIRFSSCQGSRPVQTDVVRSARLTTDN
jgi:hypothetical protein